MRKEFRLIILNCKKLRLFMYRSWCWRDLNVEAQKFTHTIVLAKRSSILYDFWTYVQSTSYSEIVARKGMTKHFCEIQTEIKSL